MRRRKYVFRARRHHAWAAGCLPLPSADERKAGSNDCMTETTSVGRAGTAPQLPVHENTPDDTTPQVSTGALPDFEIVREMMSAAHRTYLPHTEGAVADYIPVLAQVSPDLFGIAIAGVAGRLVGVGDSTHRFTIQSVAKPFVFALVCEALGHREVRERLGVNATGLPFDSVMAVELAEDGLTNPLVNSGAIATTSLVPGRTAELKWSFVREGLSRFAGRDLELDEEVLASERATNGRNEAMARLLVGHGRIYFDPDAATDVYTRQGSLLVTAEDLAVMGATLADGGVNPITHRRVVSPDTCRRTLALLMTAGLYERSGDWLYEIGLPAKSGVSGGLVTIAPGKGGLATFSPRLDPAGNSVRGQRATKMLSEALGLDLLASSAIVEGS
jgi:glutaminase